MLLSPTVDISFDSPRYITIAKSIASGNGYRLMSEIDNNPVFYNNYIFPYILAPLIKLFGLNPYPLKMFMLIISLLSIFLFFDLNLETFSKKESFLLSTSLIATPLFIKFSDKLLTEPPFMLLLLLSLWCLSKYLQKNKKRYLSFFLIAAYSLIFTRTVGIIALPLLFIYSYFKKNKKLFITTIVLTAITILTIHIIQSKTVPKDHLYHIRYLLYKDAFTPQEGYIDTPALAERIIANLRFYFINIPKDIFNLPSKNVYLYAILFWSLLFLGISKIKGSLYKKKALIFFISYLSFFTIWPWQSTRFIYPIIFIIIVYLYAGLKYSITKFPINIKQIIYLTIISFIIYSGVKELSLKMTVDRVHPAELDEIVQLSSWMKNNLPKESIVLSNNTALIYMLSSKKGTYIPYSYDIEKITSHMKKKRVTHILADRINCEMARYIYPWINKNKTRLKIIKINGGTVLFELD